MTTVVFLAEAVLGKLGLGVTGDMQPYLRSLEAQGIKVDVRGVDERIGGGVDQRFGGRRIPLLEPLKLSF